MKILRSLVAALVVVLLGLVGVRAWGDIVSPSDGACAGRAEGASCITIDGRPGVCIAARDREGQRREGAEPLCARALGISRAAPEAPSARAPVPERERVVRSATPEDGDETPRATTPQRARGCAVSRAGSATHARAGYALSLAACVVVATARRGHRLRALRDRSSGVA